MKLWEVFAAGSATCEVTFKSIRSNRAVLENKKAQLMLTNPRDTFRGQSRSPNTVPFDMLGMVSY